MSVNEKKRGRPTAKQSQLSAESILESAKLLMKKRRKDTKCSSASDPIGCGSYGDLLLLQKQKCFA